MKSITWHIQLEQQHQFRGGKAPEPSKVQKENDRLNNMLLQKQLASFGKEAPMPPVPPLPKPPKFAPPPSQTPADAEAAGREFQRNRRLRRGIARSRLGAGDSGGAQAAPSPAAVAQGTKPTLG